MLIVREERSRAYLEALAGLFRSLTDARVSIEGKYEIVTGDAVLSDVDVPKKFEWRESLGVGAFIGRQRRSTVAVWIFPDDVDNVV